MERIGIAASKMAKGNLLVYNLYVILMAFLFSLFIFIVAGCSVVFALIIISYIGKELMAFDVENHWSSVFQVCMVSLTVIVTVFNVLAILKNIKFSKKAE